MAEAAAEQKGAFDANLVHAREFTDIEVPTLTVWNQLQDAGEEQLARELLDAGLMAEHYSSLLAPLVKDRTDAQTRELTALRERLSELLNQAVDVLRNSTSTNELSLGRQSDKDSKADLRSEIPSAPIFPQLPSQS